MVAPFAPHIGEELWLRLGHDGGITYAPFPVADPALLVDETVEYPVQVNGKVRGHVTVAADADAGDGGGRGAGRRPRRRRARRGHAEEGHRRARPDGQRRRVAGAAPELGATAPIAEPTAPRGRLGTWC